MSQLSYDDEDYYFQISDELESDKEFVLIIYDIVDNRKRVKLAKLLSGYGKRVQKSAFEAMLTTQRYNKLIEEIPRYIDVYKRQIQNSYFIQTVILILQVLYSIHPGKWRIFTGRKKWWKEKTGYNCIFRRR